MAFVVTFFNSVARSTTLKIIFYVFAPCNNLMENYFYRGFYLRTLKSTDLFMLYIHFREKL